jgi:alpha-N-arabinofuranosidase
MSQGTRISGNLLHDNADEHIEWSKNWNAIAANGHQDLFMEVNHGPFMVDHNLFLSAYSLNDRSQGGVYAHNIFAGAVRFAANERRKTPYHKAHSTEIAGLHDHPGGDDRFYNNWFVKRGDLSAYDRAKLPMFMDGNLYLNGAKPSKFETKVVVQSAFDPQLKIKEHADGWYLELSCDSSWSDLQRRLVMTEMLGKAKIPGLPFEKPNGTPYRLDTDYFGNKRNAQNPYPGPFKITSPASQRIKVWPIKGKLK